MGAFIRTTQVFFVLTLILILVGTIIDLAFGFRYIFLAAMIIISITLTLVTAWYSKPLALRANGARIITRDEEPRLYTIVEKVAAKAGLPMPEVGISNYGMPNAFATGRSPKNAAVVATSALLNLLNDDELEGVIGHEMSHVKNRDIMVMSATSMVVSVLTYLSRILVFSSMMNNRNRDNGGLIILLAIVSYIFVPIAGLLLQMAVSRNREYLADETGARITEKPLALASALRKLESGCASPKNNYDDVSHANMWISQPIPKKRMKNLFATHPSTESRIARLEQIAEKMKKNEIQKYMPKEKYRSYAGFGTKKL